MEEINLTSLLPETIGKHSLSVSQPYRCASRWWEYESACRLIKIWDYLSKSCIQTLEGHTSNVSFAIFHPSLPILVSGSEDGTVKIWHSSTYRLENTLDYGLERAWCVAYAKKGNDVAFGFDEGAVVVKLGREEPSVSMDSAGKVVYARNAEVLTVALQSTAGKPYFHLTHFR